MSTKLNPGKFDFYRAALPDEPYMILLARDRFAPGKIRIWTDEVRQALLSEKLGRPEVDDDPVWLARYREDMEKCREAETIAHDMVVWRAENEGAWRNPDQRPAMGAINPAIRDAVAEITRQRLCSFLVVGTGSVTIQQHKSRSWTMPGFNVRVHEFVLDSASEAFAPLAAGKALELTEWKVAGFDVQLGDVEHYAPDANSLFLRLQTVEAG